MALQVRWRHVPDCSLWSRLLLMEALAIKNDLWFCRTCGKHYRGNRRRCPNDNTRLETIPPCKGTVGQRLDDRYQLVSQLGVGGMGTVWRAYDEITQRHVALKLLNPRYASHAASAERFLSEAVMMRRVQHPNVAQLHRFGRTSEGRLFIDMEWVEGISLHEHMNALTSPLSNREAMRLIDGVLAALAACHTAGVIHCDVKPENVMIRPGGRVKLLDFGIAQEAGPLSQTDDLVVLGTPAFISPEQVRGAMIDGRTDLYLLGCLAFEVLTGQTPFDHEDPVQLCQAQLNEQPPLLSERSSLEHPDGLERWLNKLLQKSPDSRHRTARIARDSLRRIRRGESGSLRPPTSARLRKQSDQIAAVHDRVSRPGSGVDIGGLRCLIEAKQRPGSGIEYGPEALEEILRHVSAAFLSDVRDMNALVRGPRGPHIELMVHTDGDERGVICHLLDCLAELHARMDRIPEPQLELRAVVRSVDFDTLPRVRPSMLDLQPLLEIGATSHIRVDEHVARWAGRRPIVRLEGNRESPAQRNTTLYATALYPS